MLRFPRESSESEDFVRLPLDHAHDAIHILDENGVSVFDTASRTGILGFDGDEVIGRNNYHLIHEEDRDAVIGGSACTTPSRESRSSAATNPLRREFAGDS